MIFYFSGTGNSRWAATQIAALTGDETYDISKMDKVPSVQNEKQIGLVFPVYAWGVPEPILDFAKNLNKSNAFTFGICTCGEEAGNAMKKLNQIYPLSSSYSLVMPSNYIIGADVDDAQTAYNKINAANKELKTIAQEILAQKKVYRVEEGPLAWIKSGIINWGFNHFARSTKAFYVGNTCDGCGLCVKNCPASTITFSKGKPIWGEECYQCLRCINECPQKAIQYGKTTENRGRYTIEKYLKKD